MDSKTQPSAPPGPSPLRSVHTESFPPLLDHLGVSLMVTTYQAGKLVMLRADGGVLNTHFRGFNGPMGLACHRDVRRDLGVPQHPRRRPSTRTGRQA